MDPKSQSVKKNELFKKMNLTPDECKLAEKLSGELMRHVMDNYSGLRDKGIRLKAINAGIAIALEAFHDMEQELSQEAAQ